MARAVRLLVSCEHGGHRIPPRYRPLFAGQQRILRSHAGFDLGALAVARDLAAAFAAPRSASLIASTTSRLLVDLNRSVGHPRLHGEPIRALLPAARSTVVRRYRQPYRRRVCCVVERAIRGGARVVHVSCHTFTPVLGGEVHDADIGLLFDPGRPREAALARRWRAALLQACSALRVRLNYPYRGTADSMTAALRRQYDGTDYAGIELEVNQIHPTVNGRRWRALRGVLVGTLAAALGAQPGARAPRARRSGPTRVRSRRRELPDSAICE